MDNTPDLILAPPNGPRISCGDWHARDTIQRSLNLKRPPAACAC